MKTLESTPKRLAHNVINKVRKGEIVNLYEMQKDLGYSECSAKAYKATNTLQYKAEIAKLNRPIIEGLQQQINKFKDEIEKRNLKGEDTRTLVGALDIYIKNYQLLSGGATERQVFILPSEILNKNAIRANNKDIIDVKSIDNV
jgi:hypothetical protein